MRCEAESRVGRLSRRRRVLLAALAAAVGLVLALGAAELTLRNWERHIAAADRMKPGLVLYDWALGWRLAPNWRGLHHNHDFDALYTTGPEGLRSGGPAAGEGIDWAVLGDSFTFGIGVGDDQTFVHQLGERSGLRLLNFGVPGYSTDQEYLQLQRSALGYAPKGVMLVVYLGNDLFDNTLPFPLQAGYAKPYFGLENGRLVLHNTPVPRKRKPAAQQQPDLRRLVLGREGADSLSHFLNGFELVQLLGTAIAPPTAAPPDFDRRFAFYLTLFYALAEAIHQRCLTARANLLVVVLGGRSYVERPRSYAAQFQDYLRQQIVQGLPRRGIAVYDLAATLRAGYRERVGKWFYPHDGHLTPAGNQRVAELLQAYLARSAAQPR